MGPSWSWSYRSWVYNYLCNQCLPPLMRVRIPLRQGVLDTTLCDKVCQWLATGQWFSSGTPFSSTIKIDCDKITEILSKVALNTITPSVILCTLKVYMYLSMGTWSWISFNGWIQFLFINECMYMYANSVLCFNLKKKKLINN